MLLANPWTRHCCGKGHEMLMPSVKLPREISYLLLLPFMVTCLALHNQHSIGMVSDRPDFYAAFR